MTQHKTYWQVGLSNGLTLYEEKGDYVTVEGELSPWQRLLSYMAKENVTITSLALYSGDKRWVLPSMGNNPKFKAFCDAQKPLSFRAYRKMGADIEGGQITEQELYTVAEAQYENYKLQLWVSEKNPDISWVLVV